MITGIRPTPTEFPTNILSAPVDSTSLHSIPSVLCPRGGLGWLHMCSSPSVSAQSLVARIKVYTLVDACGDRVTGYEKFVSFTTVEALPQSNACHLR